MAKLPKYVQFLKARQKHVFYHALTGRKTLPGQPGSEEFETAYEELRLMVEAPDKPKAEKKEPTFQDAYDEFTRTDEWRTFSENTLRAYKTNSKDFLNAVIPGSKAGKTFGQAEIGTPEAEILPVLRELVESVKPHKGKKYCELLRHIYRTAIRKKWALRNLGDDIEYKKLPKAKPYPKWPQKYLDRFEAHHPVGSRARTAFAMARYFGTRAGDVAVIGWDQLRSHRYIDEDTGLPVVVPMIEFWTSKGAKNDGNSHVSILVRPEMEEVLNALDRSKGGTILKTRTGTPYSEDSLQLRMAKWCEEAGVPPGFTLHGLRRTFASELAVGKADLFTIQKLMGHKSAKTTIIYLNDLDAEPLAEAGLQAVKRRTAQLEKLRKLEK